MTGTEKGTGTNSAQHPQGRSGYWYLSPFPFPRRAVPAIGTSPLFPHRLISHACSILPQQIGTHRTSPSYDGLHKQHNSIDLQLLTVMEHCLQTR
jgi:hypothetical protein